MSVLLTGATGYVGGRLLRTLEAGEHKVRCLARRPEHLKGRTGPGTEVVAGDLLKRDSLEPAMRGIESAYYLVHSMGEGDDFEERERRSALNFAEAARRARVRRIIYLGGLGDEECPLSSHLRSRQEVGRRLRDSGVTTIELRASIVIGSGSLSFEMIRALVERLPVMVTPRWVAVKAQPISISELLAYLLHALRLDETAVYEIGGSDVLSYGELMQEYARQRGLRRIMIPVPVLSPRLSSLWLGLVTPLYARIGRKLVESMRYPTIVRDDAASRVFPITPMSAREAIAQALRNEDMEFALTRWSDSVAATMGRIDGSQWGGVRFGSRLIDSRTTRVDLPAARAFDPIRRIGGSQGWYYADWLWALRGYLDLLVGGVGMRRGRRHPDELRTGDVLDCWRVEVIDPNRLLRLTAEMRLPGRAWLEFEVDETDGHGTTIRQTASFDPVGLLGLAYWYGVYPLHQMVFAGMLRGIASAARETRR